MQLKELVNSQEWINKLIKLEMPIKKAYELRKFIIEVDNKLKAYNTTREDLIKKYWEEIDWQVKVKDENMQKFFNDINEIIEEEIEINIPEISIDDIDWKIWTDVLLQLTYLIK
jgi:hypothetical protein